LWYNEQGTQEAYLTVIDGPYEELQVISGIFEGFYSTTEGGAFYFSQTSKKVSIIDSFFNNCSSTAEFGALYCFSDEASLSRNCFSLCQGSSNHAFCIQLTNLTSNNNLVELVSGL
jgi:hypothetical protein